MAETKATWEELERGKKLGTEERHTMIVHRNLAELIEVDENQFLPDGYVLLPRAFPLPEAPELQGINGLTIIVQALKYAADNTDRVLLVAGHAEPPDEPDSAAAKRGALTLSEQRATNVLALLEGKRDAFIESCDGCDAATFQRLLKWAATRHHIDCDPGEVDGKYNAATRQALFGLRKHYAKESASMDPPTPAEDDYGAIYDLYDKTLAEMLEVEVSALPSERKKLVFHSTKLMGCGAEYPVPSGPNAEHLRSESTRRVDLMFLQKSEPIPEIASVSPPGFLFYGNDRRVRKLYLEAKKPPAARKVVMKGGFFETNKTFLLPEGLASIRNVVLLQAEQQSKAVLVVGHTDTSGDPSYNDPLSLDRAKAVVALLAGKVEDWTKWYAKSVPEKKRWGSREDRAMLREIDGGKYLLEPQPIRSYQRARGLDDSNVADDATRDQLVADFMALWGLKMAPGVELVAHGCGENFPVVDTGDGKNEAQNRRVELFLFAEKIDPAPPGENSAPGSTEYKKWQEAVVSTRPYAAFTLVLETDSPHFAPGHEKLSIKYKLEGIALADVTALRLKVLRAKDLRVLGAHKLRAPFEGTLEWHGRFRTDKGSEGVSLRHQQYLLELEAESIGATGLSNQVPVEVIFAKIELKPSDHADIPINALYRKPVRELVAEIGTGDKGRLILDSSLFKMNSDEMNDRTSFDQYQGLWGSGPTVPFVVKLWVKNKAGTEVHHGNASRGGRVIFDFELEDGAAYDASLGARAPHAQAKAFLSKIGKHKEAASTPAGCAAHADVGGMRGGSEARWKSIKDDWKPEPLKQRTWSARALAAFDAKLGADCGVLFVSGRMAGDTHKVSAYFEGQDDLDTKDKAVFDALDATRKTIKIAMTTWRRIRVTGNAQSGSSTQLNLTKLAKEYAKAAVIIEPTPGLGVRDIKAAWKTHYQAVITKMAEDEDFIKYAAEADPLGWPVRYAEFADYKKRRDDDSLLGGIFDNVFGITNEAEYRAECDRFAYRIYSEVALKFPLNEGGLNFFKFGENGDHNQWLRSYTAGIAPSIDGYSSRTKSVFFVFTMDEGTDTLIHEVGHLVFLAHAPGHFNAGEQPAGYQPEAHDQADTCTMSYAKPKNGLCGLCLSKLSGWNYLKVHKDGTIS